jgi:hypothetical protein
MKLESNNDRVESTYVSNRYWEGLMSLTCGTKCFLTTSLQFGSMRILENHTKIITFVAGDNIFDLWLQINKVQKNS